MQSRCEERDFSGYNAAQADRPVRPLAVAAVEAVDLESASAPRMAIELGCGRGVEARFLAENGFSVLTYDADRSIEPLLVELGQVLPITHSSIDLARISALPPAHLVLSCATLPFVRREAFPALWRSIRESLRPGGVLAVDLFGDRDDWAATDGTFLTRDEVEELLRGLEVVDLVEEECEGRSFSGAKHWHTYRVVARRS